MVEIMAQRTDQQSYIIHVSTDYYRSAAMAIVTPPFLIAAARIRYWMESVGVHVPGTEARRPKVGL